MASACPAMIPVLRYNAPRRKRDSRTGGMMSQGELRIGIVGAGQVTRSKHLPAFRRLPGVKVVAVCNRHRESAAELPASSTFPDLRLLGRIDRRPRDRRGSDRRLAVPALPGHIGRAGRRQACLTQARMAMNAREAQRMLDRSREYPDLTTMIVPSPYGLTGEAFVRT